MKYPQIINKFGHLLRYVASIVIIYGIVSVYLYLSELELC